MNRNGVSVILLFAEDGEAIQAAAAVADAAMIPRFVRVALPNMVLQNGIIMTDDVGDLPAE